MILIIGPYPSRDNEQDGMIQRVAAIDGLMEESKRIYISSIVDDTKYSFLRHPKKFFKNIFSTSNKKINGRVVTYSKASKDKLKKLAFQANLIYLHSLHFACLLDEDFIILFKNKIVMDIHGCVVEELEYQKQSQEIINKFKKIESIVFNNVKTLISVSDNMTEFYKIKYPKCKARFVKFPIFNFRGITEKNKVKSENPLVLYAGGTQKWQNVELMIQAIKQQKRNFNFVVLTPDIEYFKNILEISNNITIKSVRPEDISQEYQKAHFGFILRDNIIVNTVACPTKLIEYLEHGLIPIVLQPEIGDFNRLGYKYILNKDFLEGILPNYTILEEMRDHNYKIIEALKQEKESTIKHLKGFLKC